MTSALLAMLVAAGAVGALTTCVSSDLAAAGRGRAPRRRRYRAPRRRGRRSDAREFRMRASTSRPGSREARRRDPRGAAPPARSPRAHARPGMPAGSEYVRNITWRSSIRMMPERLRATWARGCRDRRAARQRRRGIHRPFVVLERFHLRSRSSRSRPTVFLLALTIMLVDERRPTVGVLRLIGLPTRRILVQLFIEGVLIATAGQSSACTRARRRGIINRFFQWRYDTALVFVRVTPRWRPSAWPSRSRSASRRLSSRLGRSCDATA